MRATTFYCCCYKQSSEYLLRIYEFSFNRITIFSLIFFLVSIVVEWLNQCLVRINMLYNIMEHNGNTVIFV